MYCLCKGLGTITTHTHHFKSSISCSTTNANANANANALKIFPFTNNSTQSQSVTADNNAIEAQKKSGPIINKNPVVVDFLVKEYGVTVERAIFVSKHISGSATPATLQIVPAFLKENGFTDADVKTIISKRTQILCYNVDRTLKPKFEYFRDLGFNGNDLVQLFMKNPTILMFSLEKYLIPQVDFLRVWLHSNENIVKALKRHSWILTNAQNVRMNVDIIKDVGVRDQDITCLLLRCPRFFAERSDWVKGILERAEAFGVDHESRMYIEAVRLMACLSKDTVEAKFEVYKSYGWSQDEIVSAFKIYPTILGLSERNIRETMNYLIDEVGYDPRFVALRPFMLGCSLEKVLKPRNEMLNTLLSRGLLKKKPDFYSITYLSKEKFLQKYVTKDAYEIADP